MIQSILTTALLLAPTAPVQDTLGPTFPDSSGPLTIEVSADAPGMTYLQLLRSYGELTDQHITFGEDTEQLLSNQRVHLDRTVQVPAAEVQTFVEHLLVRGHFVLTVLKADGIRLLEVSSLATAARNNLRSGAFYLPASRIDIAKAHPAMLFVTTVTLPNTDVRQVSNSMRTMITDANTQQMLPAGNSNSMVLVGFGDQVAALAEMLMEIDRASTPASKAPKPVFEVIRLEKAVANEMAHTLMGLVRDATTQVQAQGPQGVVIPTPLPKIMADQRTNSLLITCTSDQLAGLKELIALLDV